MSNQRTHHVTTTDGVTIGGTVHGQGPPLVFVQGMIGDGDMDWQALLPHLTKQFTCHLPSMRGRGLSGDHPDLSLGRQVEDLITYVDSIGGPAGVVGWSGGGGMALTAAARCDAFSAVAAVEAGVMSLMDKQEQAALGGTMARVVELVNAGNPTAAVRAFAGWPFTDEDIAVAEDAAYFEAAAGYVPNLLNTVQQWLGNEGPSVDDPAVLGAVSAPVLVLLGSRTKPLFATSAQHVTARVPDARIQELPGVGHAAPLTHPEVLAEALAEFFSRAPQPA